MSQDRSAARAMQIASAALAHMKIEGVAPTPENYMLWFYYFEGSKPELKKVLEAERSAKSGISEHRSELIFNRFFNAAKGEPDPGPMLEWSSRMEQTASQICLHPMIFCKPLGGQGFFCGRPRWLDRKLQVAENDLAWM